MFCSIMRIITNEISNHYAFSTLPIPLQKRKELDTLLSWASSLSDVSSQIGSDIQYYTVTGESADSASFFDICPAAATIQFVFVQSPCYCCFAYDDVVNYNFMMNMIRRSFFIMTPDETFTAHLFPSVRYLFLSWIIM